MNGMLHSFCNFASLHFGELLTFGVSLGALVVSWICIKRTMKVEIKKSIILRKLDYAERALIDLSSTIEDAKALLLVINGNLSDEYLEIVRQSLNQGFAKYAMTQNQMRSNLMLADVYFDFINLISIEDSVEKIKQISAKSRQWDAVEMMEYAAREELRMCIKEVGLIIEKELAHYQAMRSTLFKKFNNCLAKWL